MFGRRLQITVPMYQQKIRSFLLSLLKKFFCFVRFDSQSTRKKNAIDFRVSDEQYIALGKRVRASKTMTETETEIENRKRT